MSAIFGPILIRKQSQQPGATPDSQNMKEITKLTEIMIEQVEELFGFFKFGADSKFEDVYEVRHIVALTFPLLLFDHVCVDQVGSREGCFCGRERSGPQSHWTELRCENDFEKQTQCRRPEKAED